MEHGRSAKALANQTLSTTTSAGQEQLRIETQYDSAIANLVTRYGRPDYLHIVNRDKLYLFFNELDSVALIERALVPPGEVKLFRRTPGFLLKLLPTGAANALLSKRKSSHKNVVRRSPTQGSKARSQSARPASRAPTTPSLSLNKFDSSAIVARLRAPLSAADPGVSNWNFGRWPNGSIAQIADDGSTRYQIGPDSVIVRTRIRSSRHRSTEGIERGAYRLNRAIFGTRASAVDREVKPLITRVAADSSSQRSQLSTRVAGRTVLITRDPKQGFLFYTIAAH
jgi:hypothetical protein